MTGTNGTTHAPAAVEHATSWVLEPLTALLPRSVLGVDDDALGRALAATAARWHRCGGPERAAALAGSHRLVAELQADLSQSVREQIVEIALAPPALPPNRIVWQSVHDICKPLPPMPWLSRGLQLGAGRPYLLIAYAFGLKSLTAQALALAVATGHPAWGHFACERGRVLHFDHEQGKRATVERYQRLMRGMRLDAADVGDNLRLAVFPDLHLTDPDAADVLARSCEGAQLALIDSLRASIKGIEENSSEVRAPLDLLTRVSEKTGCAFVVLHHAGKSGRDNGYADGRMVARGSSAIIDAAGGALVLHPPADKGEPRRVEQVKSPAEAAGGAIDDFLLAVEDVPCDGAHGLQIAYRAMAAESTAKRVDRYEADAAKLLELVKAEQGITQNRLIVKAGLNRTRARDVLAALVEDGRLAELPGVRGAKTYRAGEPS